MRDRDVAADTRPIATYTERLLEVRREFALYEDRVVVRARWLLKGQFEHVIRLAALNREIQELTIRYRMYRYAGWAMALGGLAFVAAHYFAGGEPVGTGGQIALAVMILGTAVMALAYPNRRIRFARFNTKAGRAGLDIGSAGNSLAAFKEFVEQVRRQISKA